ncbi:DUF2975 domain-containing protein [Planomicrobium okeanokoites]|uniref:DUF2975 domain-containing protein n=1 Tax=Planomicrobium okeanokoites TaxID=244 RepID=UPI000A06FDEE|nr:DUF2975 domain-containing protein [Planomicrobium okeanokoites]
MTRKQASTLFLKVVLLLIAGAVLALCVFGLPGMAARDAELHPETAYLQYPFLLSAYVFFIPIFIAMYQAFMLLTYVERNQAFSELAVKSLKIIRYCAYAVIAFIVLGELATIALIRGEDITHIITLGAIGSFACITIAVFAGLLQKLLKDAIRIRSDNEMIV